MEISCRLWFMWMQNLWSKYWLRIAPLINCAGCKSTDIEIRPVDLSQIQHSAHLTNRSACRLSQYLYIYCEASVVYQIDTRFHLTTWAASTSMCSRSGNVIACLSSPCKQIIRSKPLRFLLKTSPSTVSTDYFHVCAGGTEVCVWFCKQPPLRESWVTAAGMWLMPTLNLTLITAEVWMITLVTFLISAGVLFQPCQDDTVTKPIRCNCVFRRAALVNHHTPWRLDVHRS